MSALSEAVSPPHRMCSALMVPGLADDTLHRVVLTDGAAHEPTPEDPATLGDAFARLLLAEGVFPRTAGEVLQRLVDVLPVEHPLRTQRFFMVGEGGQIPDAPTVSVDRNLRFVVACGRGPDGPDIILSSFHPDAGIVELMAWDDNGGGFNFYRTMPDSSAWIFAGNSRHALTSPTRGNGPFESHVNGHFLMKELSFPWVNWHSPVAHINPSVLAAQGLETHPWVTQLEEGGGYTLEDDIAKPAIERWTRARIAALKNGSSDETPHRLVEQVTSTLTVNLISSRTTSSAAITGTASEVPLPASFFSDSAAFEVVGLNPAPAFSVASTLYAQALTAVDARLDDGNGFRAAGDTHFAFVVPVRAHEDVVTVRQAIEQEVLSRRLLACLLMVDFPNPVFSLRRSTLLAHLEQAPFDASVDQSVAMAQKILSSAEAATAGSPEAEFVALWQEGEEFEAAFNGRLEAYYSAISQRLTTASGFESFVRLAESRRNRVRAMPISESRLLFAETNIPPGDLVMRADGAVE